VNNVIFWGSTSQENVERLFKMQKRAVRIICKIRKEEHCKPLFKSLELLTLPCIIIKESALFVKKNCDNFNERQGKCLIDKFSLSISERSPDVFCKRIFNSLPVDVRKSVSLNVFRRQLHAFLVGEAFFSLKEFFERATRL